MGEGNKKEMRWGSWMAWNEGQPEVRPGEGEAQAGSGAGEGRPSGLWASVTSFGFCFLRPCGVRLCHHPWHFLSATACTPAHPRCHSQRLALPGATLSPLCDFGQVT